MGRYNILWPLGGKPAIMRARWWSFALCECMLFWAIFER